MKTVRLYREYRLKSYLNMNHYITIDGNPGQVHPHTWELVFVAIIRNDDFLMFSTIEKLVEEYLDKFQNKVLNDIHPFDVTNPTIENVVDFLADELRERARARGIELLSVEGSETPTRSYIVTFSNDEEYIRGLEKIKSDRISSVIDYIVDGLAEDREINR